MCIPINNTHLKFVEPLYHFGQKLKTSDGWGIVTGMQYTFTSYQQWKYNVAPFLEEGFSETAYTYSENELEPIELL